MINMEHTRQPKRAKGTKTAEGKRPASRGAVWLVAAGVFLVYCATLSGEGGSTYGQAYLTAKSLVETGDLSIDATGAEVSPDRIGSTFVNANGERYAVTGVLWSLVVLPFYAVAHAATGGAETGSAAVLGKLLTGLYDPLLYALCGALLFSICTRLSGSPLRGWGIVMLWSFATMTWGVSKYSSYVSLLSSLLLGVVWFLSTKGGTPSWRAFLGAGACLAMVALARTQEVALIPAGMLYAGARLRALPSGARKNAAALFMAPIVLALVALALLNMHKFSSGHPFGYTSQPSGPLWVGLWGLLLSPGRSILLFCPPVVLGLWCLLRTGPRWVPERLFLAVAAVIMLLLYASFRCWPGDWGDWGPRYLAPLVPLLLVPLAMVDGDTWGRSVRRAALVAGIVGVLVQIPGVLLRPGAYQWPLRVVEKEGASLGPVDSLFWPQFSPVFLGYRLLYEKTVAMASGVPPSLTLQICDANSVVRAATVPLTAEMLRNSDFVSHALFSLEQGSFSRSHQHWRALAWVLRVAQGGVFVSGLLCLICARRRLRETGAGSDQGPAPKPTDSCACR